MSRKIILTDVDGTLIPYHDTEPPVSVEEAVRRLHEKGNEVYMVTGRTLAHINGRLAEIPFDGMIGGNGAFTVVHGNMLSKKTIPDEEIVRIVDYLDSRNLEYFIETVDGQFGSHHFETRAVKTLEQYGIKNPVVRDIYPQMKFPECLYVSQVTKINFILESMEDYTDMKKAFGGYKVSTWGGKGESALFGDIAQEGIDKNIAVRDLIAYLGAEKQDTYGFGDAEVDIPLFESCGVSVCMGDGRDAAKAAADYVTDSAARDGWLKACLHFGLI